MSNGGKAAAERHGTAGTRPAAGRVQPKLKVGAVNDPTEHEADAVSERVVAGQPAAMVSRMAAPEKKPEPVRRAAAPEKKKEEPVRRAAAPEKKKEEPVRRAAAPEKKKEEPVRRAAAPEKKEPVRRQVDEEEIQAKSAGSSSEAMSSAAQHAVDAKGPGRPLDSSVRSRIESSVGADLGHVRVHDDAGARASASALNARAFTHGSDIWMGPGESGSDVRLMAHEAAHVLQQGGRAQRLVQRANGGSPAPAAPMTEDQARPDLQTFRLPPIKARHRPIYEAWAVQGTLKRVMGYERGEPDQKDSVWLPTMTLPQERLDTLQLTPNFTGIKKLKVGTHEFTGSYTRLMNLLKVPQWDRTGRWMDFPMEVDHIVELQVGSWAGGTSGPANEIQNMELLDKSSNASAGSRTRTSIRRNVERFLEATGRPHEASHITSYLAANDVPFNRVVPGTDGGDGGSQHWSRAEIQAGDHLQHVQGIGNVAEHGSATSFALVSAGGTLIAEYPRTGGAQTITIPPGPDQRRVAGLIISSINLQANAAEAARDAQVGTVQASLELPPQFTTIPPPMTTALHSAGQYSAYLADPPAIGDTDFPSLSLIHFEPPTIDGAELVASARLTPSLPLLGTTPIDVVLRGGHLAFVYFYSAGELALPLPGIHIDDVTLGIMFGTEGFRAEGALYFSVDRLGHGSLTAGVDGRGNFEAGGSFDFDSELFDQARIEVWYRERAFGGRGTLRITRPDKVRGIRALDAEVTFGENQVAATGTVRPDIPGVETATLRIEYSEADGLLIAGSATLSDRVPGIRSGTLEAEVRQPPEGGPYKLSARGTAVPAIPGLDTTLTVEYDDGALTIAGTADYSRGMLSGTVQLGSTNRVLDATGMPTDAIGTELRVYGGGTLTVRVTPWLQGTVGVRFLPNGELELTGSIALPATLDIFPEKRLDRNIFSINIDIPIVGFAVAGQRIGIFATIGGGLDLTAGIGPGQLRELGISITYNPAHEDQTQIHGGAKLVIPAHAGLRLFIRGALGAGIPIVSASLGLEVGGQLGLEGAVEASVVVDWTPSTGLVLDALGEIYVQPKFRFDLTGFLTVDADLLLTTINLYEKRWELAAFELGPNLRFGVRFPIHYEEGQPFDISMDDLQFEVPKVDTKALLGEIIDKIV